MAEAWLIEFIKAIGKLFINPLFYWSLVLVIWTGYRRVKRERYNFGMKIFDVFSEWQQTWGISLLFGLLLSVFALGFGIVLTPEMVILLSIVPILLSLTFNLMMLSANYTIGITYILLLFLPFIVKDRAFFEMTALSNVYYFTSLTTLLGFFLLIEANLLVRVHRNETYPGLALSERGVWVGQHQIKKLAIIPFFALMPTGLITPFASFWPYLQIGDETFSLILFPFLLGFQHHVKSDLPHRVAEKLARSIIYLGFIVVIFAIGSIYLPLLSFIGVIVALLGREWILYRHRTNERQKNPYFYPPSDGVRVLGIVPNTLADRLGLQVGEKITKVNDERVTNTTEFYEALQKSKASFVLRVIDDQNEVRLLEGAIYETDHHRLGLIFPEKPYRLNK